MTQATFNSLQKLRWSRTPLFQLLSLQCSYFSQAFRVLSHHLDVPLRNFLSLGAQAGAVLDERLTARVTPAAIPPERAPHTRVVVHKHILFVAAPCLGFLPLDNAAAAPVNNSASVFEIKQFVLGGDTYFVDM